MNTFTDSWNEWNIPLNQYFYVSLEVVTVVDNYMYNHINFTLNSSFKTSFLSMLLPSLSLNPVSIFVSLFSQSCITSSGEIFLCDISFQITKSHFIDSFL